jgi:hypothetical protein
MECKYSSDQRMTLRNIMLEQQKDAEYEVWLYESLREQDVSEGDYNYDPWPSLFVAPPEDSPDQPDENESDVSSISDCDYRK